MTSILTGAAQAAHSAVATVLAHHQIQPGQPLPAQAVKESDNAEKQILIHNLKGKILIVGVPGAFTPPCSSHVPGYIENYDKFKEKGIEEILVVAVNDAFVLKGWKEKLAPKGTPVRFIADDKGTFTAHMGLLFDATPLLGAPRSKRYAIVAEDGKVVTIAVEAEAPHITVASAESILAQL